MPVADTAIEEVWNEIDKIDSYARLGLSRNPFPASGNPPAGPSISPYPEIYRAITDFLGSFLRTHQSRGLVLLGDYGTGKTYHLRWIEELLGAKPEVAIQIVYIETPGLEPYDLVREILAQIGDQGLARAIWSLVLPVLRKHIHNEGQKFLQQFAEGKTKPKGRGPQISLESVGLEIPLLDIRDEIFYDYRDFLSEFDRTGALSREELRDWAYPLLCRPKQEDGLGITNNAAIARELANICFLAGVPALQSWERLTVASKKSPFPARGEPEFLQTILRLLVATGTDYFVLLLDEFEKIPLMERMTSRDMKRYLDTVRMLADRGWQEEAIPFAWVIASHDEAWAVVRDKLNPAMSQRFLTEVHLPRSNDPNVAHYLISQHLALVRLNGRKEHDLEPFPYDFIQLVSPQLRRTPRDLLLLCYRLIEAAVRQDVELENGIIPEEFVIQYLQRDYHSQLIQDEDEFEQ